MSDLLYQAADHVKARFESGEECIQLSRDEARALIDHFHGMGAYKTDEEWAAEINEANREAAETAKNRPPPDPNTGQAAYNAALKRLAAAHQEESNMLRGRYPSHHWKRMEYLKRKYPEELAHYRREERVSRGLMPIAMDEVRDWYAGITGVGK